MDIVYMHVPSVLSSCTKQSTMLGVILRVNTSLTLSSTHVQFAWRLLVHVKLTTDICIDIIKINSFADVIVLICFDKLWSFDLMVKYLFITGVTRSKDLEQYLRSNTDSTRAFGCEICGKDFVRRDHVINHLESVHFPNSYAYPCTFCGSFFNTRNKLYKHTFKFHKESV